MSDNNFKSEGIILKERFGYIEPCWRGCSPKGDCEADGKYSDEWNTKIV